MVITSRSNPLVKSILALRDKKARRERGEYIAEGIKQVREAVACGCKISCIVYAESFSGERFFPDLAQTVSDSVFEKLSEEVTPQGVLAVIKIPDTSVRAPQGRCLLLDGVSDPGNVGTMIRTADAMGLDGVVLSRECCDLYNMKTLRAAMGSLFRMPVLVTDMEDFLHRYRGQLTSYAAVVGEATPLTEVSFPGRSVILIGNEGNGLSAHQAACCDSRITIPMTGRAESLNAAMAATILMWELSRSRMGKNCPERSNHETN